MFHTTFIVIHRLRCNILSMETNGCDQAARGRKYILKSIIYTQPTFIHTHADTSLVGIPSFAENLQTVHTSSICTPHSTDGFVMVHLALRTISGPCRAIGFHSVSLEITRGKKNTHTHTPKKNQTKKKKKQTLQTRQVSKISSLTEGMLWGPNVYKKSKFH